MRRFHATDRTVIEPGSRRSPFVLRSPVDRSLSRNYDVLGAIVELLGNADLAAYLSLHRYRRTTVGDRRGRRRGRRR